jgi:ferredoxin
MTVQVDRDKCEGFGFCEEAAPEVFQLGDDGILHIQQPAAMPALLREKVASAVRVCPVAALRLREPGPADG